MQHIWAKDNSATVNDIIERWTKGDAPGYTTVLKTLQKMEEKGIVGHESQGRKYAYFAKISKQQVAYKHLNTLVERVFGGNQLSFAQYFIDSRDLDAEDLKALKKLIAQKEKEIKQ